MGKGVCWIWMLCLAILLCGCEKSTTFEGPVRIGLVSYLKGEQREKVGKDTLVAANMALEEINREGGVRLGNKRLPVELVVKEIDSNAEQAMQAVHNLINNQHVVAIVGPYFSSDAIPAGAIAEQSKVPMIAPVATHPDVTTGRRYVLRGTFLDRQQGEALASFAVNDLDIDTAVVVFDESNQYSKGLARDFSRAFEKRQGRILFSRGLVKEEMLDSRLWREIATRKPDVVFLPIYSPLSAEVADKARESGYQGVFLGSDAWDSRYDAQKESLQNAYMTSNFSRRLEMPATQSFVSEFNKRRGREPGDSAALTYDAIKLLGKALERAGKTDSEALLQALFELPPYFGVAGSIDYVDSGNPIKAVVINQLRDGDAHFQKFIVLEQ